SGGTGGGLTSIGSVTSLYGGSYRFRQFGGVTGDGYFVHVEDNYDETVGANNSAADTDGVIELVSIGRVRGAERIVRGTVIHDPGLGSFYGRNFVTISGGSR